MEWERLGFANTSNARKKGRKEEGRKTALSYWRCVALPFLRIIEQLEYGAYGVLWLRMGWDGQLQQPRGLLIRQVATQAIDMERVMDEWMDGWRASLAEYTHGLVFFFPPHFPHAGWYGVLAFARIAGWIVGLIESFSKGRETSSELVSLGRLG